MRPISDLIFFKCGGVGRGEEGRRGGGVGEGCSAHEPDSPVSFVPIYMYWLIVGNLLQRSFSSQSVPS